MRQLLLHHVLCMWLCEVNADGHLTDSCQWKRTRREHGLICSICTAPIPGRMNHWSWSACMLPACGRCLRLPSCRERTCQASQAPAPVLHGPALCAQTPDVDFD
eukprot:932482-Prorocentrum_lima.AAC.1